MEALAIVTALALLQTTYFAFMVGKARQRHQVSAPTISGPDAFEREFRVHQNTMEQLVVFVPALWMFGYFVNPLVGAGIGLLYVVSRHMYRSAYLNEPKARSTPFMIGLLSFAVLTLGSMIGATLSWLGQ